MLYFVFKNNIDDFNLNALRSARTPISLYVRRIQMLQIFKTLSLVTSFALVLGLSGCATLSEAYDSAANSVSDLFKSDSAKKD